MKVLIALCFSAVSLLAQGAFAPVPIQQPLDNNGKILIGGCLYTFATGSTTPLATYSNQGLTVANTNPIVLNASGRAPAIFIRPVSYKFVFAQRTVFNTCPATPGTVIWSQDPVFDEAQLLQVNLALTTGAGMIGYSATVSYPAGTIGAKLHAIVYLKDAPWNLKCDGNQDEYAGVTAASAANPNAILIFPAGTCKTSHTLQYPSNQEWRGASPAFQDQGAGQTTIHYTGTAGVAAIGPLNATTVNFWLRNMVVDGTSLANPIVSWSCSAYGGFENGAVTGSRAAADGIVVDGSGGCAAYENHFLQIKGEGLGGCAFVFSNSANGNILTNDKAINQGATNDSVCGISFRTLSAQNLVSNFDAESFCSDCNGVPVLHGTAYDLQAAGNTLIQCRAEQLKNGLVIGAAGTFSTVIPLNMATTVTTPVTVDSAASPFVNLQILLPGNGDGLFYQGNYHDDYTIDSGGTNHSITILPGINTGEVLVTHQYGIVTSGIQQEVWYNNTTREALFNWKTGTWEMNDLILDTGGSIGHAACLTAARKIGYCSTVVDASGLCTCN